MSTNARLTARHNRAVGVGVGISAAIHVALLTAITVPGAGPAEDGGRDARTSIVPEDLDAIEVVQVVEEVPQVPASIRPTEADAASGAQPTPSIEAPSRPSLEDRLADLAPASVAVRTPDTGRPVVTFKDLEPVAQTEAMMAAFAYGGGLRDGEEDEGGGWSAFLGGISAALSGGGHCPTPGGAGPMVLR